MAQKFGRWETVESIGEGGQGHVLKVVDLEGDKTTHYALKRLKNIRRLERFKSEIDAVRSIYHPNIVKVIDFDLESPKPYYVSLYYPLGDLTGHQGRWADDALTALKLFRYICQGVSAAHSKNIIHRDLKPENILMADGSTPVVADFGLAYIEDGERMTLTEEAVGPRNYMAPELEDGRTDKISPRSDIYSLGKILYWMLSNGRIFSREKQNQPEFDLSRIHSLEVGLHINPILNKSITSSDKDRFISVNELIESVREAERSLAGFFNRSEVDSQKQCRNCGYSKMDLIINTSESQNNRNFTQLDNFGFRAVGNPDWRIYICPRCSNVTIFRPDQRRRN